MGLKRRKLGIILLLMSYVSVGACALGSLEAWKSSASFFVMSHQLRESGIPLADNLILRALHPFPDLQRVVFGMWWCETL